MSVGDSGTLIKIWGFLLQAAIFVVQSVIAALKLPEYPEDLPILVTGEYICMDLVLEICYPSSNRSPNRWIGG